MDDLLKQLNSKALWVRKALIDIHGRAPGTRLASSLSPIELLVTLYYGGILAYNPKDISWPQRDRLIASKGHGAIALYPILADLGYFPVSELQNVCGKGSFLGGIPDAIIPGFETMNGSLGHGLGVACGIALALKRKQQPETVFVLHGDGELYEGSVWEAVMLAGEHKLDNLILLVDYNKISMLDYCNKIINWDPMGNKFREFRWHAYEVDGHDIAALHSILRELKQEHNGYPKVLICHTVKGKGVAVLENDPLCHLRNLSAAEVVQAQAALS